MKMEEGKRRKSKENVERGRKTWKEEGKRRKRKENVERERNA